MAEEKLPNRSPWLDDIKKTKQLTIYFHDSLGKTGWEQVFKDAIFQFNNKLSSNHNLGVTFVQEGDRKKANVEAQASRGTVEIEYLPYLPKTTISFDGTTAHGLNRAVRDKIKGMAKVE